MVGTGPSAVVGGPSGAYVYEYGQVRQIGGEADIAYDVNDSGRLAGDFGSTPGALSNAAAWLGSSVTWLAEAPGTVGAAARGIANGDWVTGYAPGEGEVWSAARGRMGQVFPPTHRTTTNFGPVAPDGFTGLAINPSREVAGAALRAGVGSFKPFSALWTRRHGAELISGQLSAGGMSAGGGVARSVNGAGAVVGWDFDDEGRSHAFLWSRLAGTLNLPETVMSQAHAINSRGEIVGWNSSLEGQGRACLWRPSQAQAMDLIDLNDLLSAEDQAAWTLSVAYDINDRGQIVGLAQHDGASSLVGFLLTIPG